MKPRFVLVVTVLALMGARPFQAQGVEATIRQLEQERIEAARAGRSLAAFNADDYFDIIPPGTTRTNHDFNAEAPRPDAYRNPDLHVRVVGDVAIVTGTAGGPSDGSQRDRILRVWRRQGRTWKAVGYHGTWIGERTNAATTLTQAAPPTSVFRPDDATHRAIWDVHTQIEQAAARSDTAAYRRLVTPDFVRVTSNGDGLTLDQWVRGFSGQTRQPSVQSEVRLRVMGDVAIMSYLNFRRDPQRASSPERMTRLFLRQNGGWKLMYTQSTTARQPAAATPTSPTRSTAR